MGLNIIVVGAGLAGLGAAIGCSRYGHTVTVYERRTTIGDEEGSGIQFQPNVQVILKEWGMLDEVKKLADENKYATMKDHDQIMYRRPFVHGTAWFASRQTFRGLFRRRAEQLGIKIINGVNIESVDLEKPAITLEGRVISADLILAADGTGSKIRKTIFPDYQPTVLDMAAFQLSLPLDKVLEDEVMSELTDESNNTLTASPGRCIFAASSYRTNKYDFQLLDHEYTVQQDPHPSRHTERLTDLSYIRQRWNDHGDSLNKALSQCDSVFKWRFREIYGLPSWSSKNGKVILLGDACHSMTPYAGQGSAMAIEDAAALSELLKNVRRLGQLASVAQQYEQIRRPRCERVQALARAYGNMWSTKDPGKIRKRNEGWKYLSTHGNSPSRRADINAAFGHPDFIEWLEAYNVFETVQDLSVSSRL